ncbi:DUF4097 family beta strand repeat-containing protein, partial [bacterium]|nr:DUF4097 family beta strand repeat-containing protein [bacterium]
GPSRPFELNWLEGSLVVNNWKSKGSIDLQSGAVRAIGYEGNLKLWLQSGIARLQNYKGSLYFKSYKAKVFLENSEGDVELDNFMGQSQVTEFKGDINLESRLGQVKVSKGEGKLDFKLGRAKINIDNFDGSIRGKSGQGQVTGVLKGDVDVRVRTDEGSVNLKLPRSGAQLDLGTKEGDFRVPSFLKLTRYSFIKVVKGRLRGPSRGNVFVRTKSGSIKIR